MLTLIVGILLLCAVATSTRRSAGWIAVAVIALALFLLVGALRVGLIISILMWIFKR